MYKKLDGREEVLRAYERNASYSTLMQKAEDGAVVSLKEVCYQTK